MNDITILYEILDRCRAYPNSPIIREIENLVGVLMGKLKRHAEEQLDLFDDNHTEEIFVADLVRKMKAIKPSSRLYVMCHFCRSCGDDNPECQCWNDE